MRALTLLSTAVALSLLHPAVAGAEERSYNARPAAAFVDSVGVNIHANYTDTVYKDQERTIRLLRELGIKHVRDGVKAEHPTMHRTLRRLRDEGIGASLILDAAGRYGAGTLDEQIAALNDPNRLQGVAVTLEGENERDGDGVNADDIARQRQVHAAVEGSPALADLPLLGPSWARGSRSVPQWGRADTAGIADAWNLHPYPGGHAPDAGSSTGQFGEPLGAISEQVAQAKALQDKPVYATETGYHNAVRCDGRGHNPTSERAAGPYTTRLALEYFRVGVVRSFFYELQDERPEAALCDREQHFGLVRYDGSLKPAYTQLQTLLRTLDDAPGATTRQVSLDVEGPADLRVLPLTRSDGGLDVVVWRPIPLQRPTGANPPQLPDDPAPVTISAAGEQPSAVVRTQAGEAGTVGAAPVIYRFGDVPAEPTPAPERPTEPLGRVDVGLGADDGGTLTQAVSPTGRHLGSSALSPELRTTRWGSELAWSVPVEPGTYDVTVTTVEPTFRSAGARVFDLTVGGQTQAGIDVFARVGRHAPLELTFAGVDATDGTLEVSAKGTTENAIVALVDIAEPGAAPAPEIRVGTVVDGQLVLTEADKAALREWLGL